MATMEVAKPIGGRSLNLKFSIFRNDLKRRATKKLILKQVIANIYNALNIFTNILRKNEYHKYFDVINKVFEWQMKHFEERMNPNDTYVDTMHLEDARTLEIDKMITDFDNIKVLLQQIYENRPLAHETLRGCMQLLDIREALDGKYKENVEILADLREHYLKRHQVLALEIQSRVEKRNRILEKNTVETLILDPIHWRYILNTESARNEFIRYELKQKNDEIDNKSHYYVTKGEHDSMATSSTYSYLNMEIQHYKSKISHWSWKYEVDFDKAVNDVGLLKENIKVLEKRYADLKERYNWYLSERERRAEEEAAEKDAILLQMAKSEFILAKKKKSVYKHR